MARHAFALLFLPARSPPPRHHAAAIHAGYSSLDLVTTFFKVVKGMDSLPEPLKLDFLAQVSAAHMRVVDGVGSLLQMQGLASKLSGIARESGAGGGAGAPRAPGPAVGAGAGSSTGGGGMRF